MANTKGSRETTTQATRQGGGSEQTTQQGGKGGQTSAQQQPLVTQRGGGQGGAQGQQTGMSRRGQFAPLLFASPFSLMRMLNEEMARMFTDSGAGRGSQASSGAGEVATWSPRVEAFERDGQLVVRADLPGMSKDDVDVEIADDALIIRGERRQEHEEHRDGFSVCEVTHGSFYRRIPLPEGVNTQNAAATFRDGVLEIKMQVPQREASSRRLEVQDGGRTAEQSQTQTQAAGSKS